MRIYVIPRSKRGNRCSLKNLHLMLFHCTSCGIDRPRAPQYFNHGKCKRCGKDWSYKVI